MCFYVADVPDVLSASGYVCGAAARNFNKRVVECRLAASLLARQAGLQHLLPPRVCFRCIATLIGHSRGIHCCHITRFIAFLCWKCWKSQYAIQPGTRGLTLRELQEALNFDLQQMVSHVSTV